MAPDGSGTAPRGAILGPVWGGFRSHQLTDTAPDIVSLSTFTDQVLSAVPRQTDTGWRLSKGKSKRKIDACIALVIALSRATERH